MSNPLLQPDDPRFQRPQVRDAAGKIVSGSMDFGANYKFAAPKILTTAHIHKGDATVGMAERKHSRRHSRSSRDGSIVDG